MSRPARDRLADGLDTEILSQMVFGLAMTVREIAGLTRHSERRIADMIAVLVDRGDVLPAHRRDPPICGSTVYAITYAGRDRWQKAVATHLGARAAPPINPPPMRT